jgi:hypothetical protein
VLWSVATSELCLTSSGGVSVEQASTDADRPQEMDDDDCPQWKKEGAQHHEMGSTVWDDSSQSKKDGDKGSEMDSVVGDHEDLVQKVLSPAANMRVKQLTKELRAKEKALIAQYDAEAKQERCDYRMAAQALRRKHQTIVDGLLERSLIERQELREAITQRLQKMAKRQEASTEQLRKKDVQVTQEALWAEDKRLADAETSSFVKAQALISAQVFHEVRNALSSVIAMSEMTTSLKTDLTISPIKLVSSMDDMLDQIKEVVYYARKFRVPIMFMCGPKSNVVFSPNSINQFACLIMSWM